METTKTSYLVVEDEPILRALIVRMLSSPLREVVAAASGPEALAYLKDHPGATVLSDMSMPGMNGLELLKQMRAAHYANRFFFMSGSIETENLTELPRLEVAGVLHKPFGRKEINGLFPETAPGEKG
ncbi:MAG: response regulator [Proteobacteria bacterium]|nr:MAG: response regulator [Pseudomonadota bacterium]